MIRFENVSYAFPDGTQALTAVDVHIQAGETLLVCGANGCGKTSFLRLLNGLLEPGAGRVLVDGQDTHGSPLAIRIMVGLVFQNPDAQIIAETVAQEVAFGPENLGLAEHEVQARVQDALSVMGLLDLAERPCHLLSGGEKRRLTLAGVLAMQPRVLALDEPLANLDHPGSLDLVARLAVQKEAGRTLVVASHRLEPFWPLADRLLILERGRVARWGAPADLSADLEQFGVCPPGTSWQLES